VLAQNERVEFHIAGADENGAWKKRWEARHSGESRVHFHGEVSTGELACLYAGCDLFVAPSTYESFGLVYLEAMAHGKPVIGCRTGGVPEVVSDGVNGLLVPPGDATALAAAIRRLCEDEGLAKRFGSAGLARFRENFTVEVMAERSLDLYRRLHEAQRSLDDVVWAGAIMDLRRESDARVLWHAETRQLCLQIPEGEARCAVFGPYARLKPGSYRAEFKLWLQEIPQTPDALGSVDIFSLETGALGSRTFNRNDFVAGTGCILDIYFAVSGAAINNAEFRFHTNGRVAIFLREVLVREWPHARVKLRSEKPEPQLEKAIGA